MYEYLDGRLASRRPTRVVLDVGGVGYDVAVPLGSAFAAGEDGRVRVWTHLVVREDAQLLYGFAEPKARELFRLLLQVRGVGPGLALAILSSLPGEALLQAVATADAATLTRIKGVGKKTADQILLDLRDRAPKPASADDKDVLVPQDGRRAVIISDAVRALISIGYSNKEAKKSVERAAKSSDTEDLETLVREALRH